MHKNYSLAYVAMYSFIPLSELGRHGENENAQPSKRQQKGFEHGNILPLSNRAYGTWCFLTNQINIFTESSKF